MELQSLQHSSVSRLKPCLVRPATHSSPSSMLLTWPNPRRQSHPPPTLTQTAPTRRQCGAHEPLSSHCHLSSATSLRRPNELPQVLPSRGSPNLVVTTSEKDRKGNKAPKGKKKGQGGGGHSRGSSSEPAKKPQPPRANVWSKDIAETEYQSSKGVAQSSSWKQQKSLAVQVKERKEGHVREERGRRSGGGAGAAQDAASSGREAHLADEYTGMLVSGGIPVEIQQVLQAPEQMPSPLWPTFVSSNAGVWRGVGAAFSPITAEMEPVALGPKNEYLYDAVVLCTVEPISGPGGGNTSGSSLHRKVMWKVGNLRGEQGFDELQIQPDLFEEEDGEGDSSVSEGINPIELASSDLSERMLYPEPTEEVFGTVEETRDFLQGLDVGGEALYNPDNAIREGGVLREGDPEWESMYKAGMVDAGLVEELKNGLVGTKVPGEGDVLTDEDVPGDEPSLAGNEVWKDVMEEDAMAMEPGLVFFSDGSYSRGPISLLPDDLAASEREYYKSPTFKIEQCLVTGKHRRLRLVHTIAIMDSGEEIQVLRVAAYEEQWMGPCNMKSISETGGAQVKPFSQQRRISPKELTGSWKVFEMSAAAVHQEAAATGPLARPPYAHFCQEVTQKQGLPEPLEEYFLVEEGEDDEEEQEGEAVMDDPSVLWLPGGITASVEAKEDGVLSVGVGWFYDDRTFLVMERDYGPDGRLAEVRSQTKVKGGWAGGRM